MSEELEHLVTGSATGSDLREAALRGGMVTLRQDGFLKAAQGITTIEAVSYTHLDVYKRQCAHSADRSEVPHSLPMTVSRFRGCLQLMSRILSLIHI